MHFRLDFGEPRPPAVIHQRLDQPDQPRHDREQDRPNSKALDGVAPHVDGAFLRRLPEVVVAPFVFGEEIVRVVCDLRMLLQERRKLRVGLEIPVVRQQRGVQPQDPRQRRRVLLQYLFERPSRVLRVHLKHGGRNRSRVPRARDRIGGRLALGGGGPGGQKEGRQGGDGDSGGTAQAHSITSACLLRDAQAGVNSRRLAVGSWSLVVEPQSNSAVSSAPIRRRPSRRYSSRPPSQIRR